MQIMKSASALGTCIAALLAATACGDSTAPSKTPTAIKVEPSQLELGVGDTGQVRVVLLAGTDTVGLRADPKGWFTWDGTARATRMVDVARTWKLETITLVAIAAGTDTFRFHYMKKSECTDPPMCYSSQYYDYLAPQMAEIVVW